MLAGRASGLRRLCSMGSSFLREIALRSRTSAGRKSSVSSMHSAVLSADLEKCYDEGIHCIAP